MRSRRVRLRVRLLPPRGFVTGCYLLADLMLSVPLHICQAAALTRRSGKQALIIHPHLVSPRGLARGTLTERPFARAHIFREDISANLGALEELQAAYGCEMLFVESGGDNLAANYSRELADYVSRVESSGGTSLGSARADDPCFATLAPDHLRDVSRVPDQPKLVVRY